MEHRFSFGLKPKEAEGISINSVSLKAFLTRWAMVILTEREVELYCINVLITSEYFSLLSKSDNIAKEILLEYKLKKK